MKFVFNIFRCFFILSSIFSRSSYYVDSEHIPLCNSKMECKSSCNCDNVGGCLLLPMNETNRNIILYYHNQMRSLQTENIPKPTGLAMLQYDMELEDISKCWAIRCSNDYSVCFRTSKFSETSQSVVQIILNLVEIPTVVSWTQMKNYWQMQAKSIQEETLRRLPSGKQHKLIHNFAQIVSDRILSVGCAWSLMERLLTFVCTYGPRGPNSGESIYKIGQTCSVCPDNYKCTNTDPFPGLCKKKSEKMMTSNLSPSNISKSLIAAESDKVYREEKRGRYASRKYFTESLPRTAKTSLPYKLVGPDKHFSKWAEASVYPKSVYTPQTESGVQLKHFIDFSSQLPLTSIQLSNRKVEKDGHLFTRHTYHTSAGTDKLNREEENRRYASWKHFTESLPRVAKKPLPYRQEGTDENSSQAKASVYPIPIHTSQTEPRVKLKQFNDFPRQLPPTHLQLPRRKMKEDAESLNRVTYALPYSSSFTESLNNKPKTSSSSIQLNVNISVSLPGEIFTLRKIFRVTGSYRSSPLYNSVSPKFIPESKYEDDKKNLPTSFPSLTYSKQKDSRLMPLFTSTKSITQVFSSKKKIHDNVRLWRKNDMLGTSNNSLKEKPSRKKDVSVISVFILIGVGILFLIAGVVLVALVMYILRMEAV